MNSKRTFLTLIFLFFSFFALAQNEEGSWAEGATEEEIKAGERKSDKAQKEQQEDEKSAWREKVFFGAGGGLQFSSFGTFIGVMPSVGYRITPKFHTGVIGIYQFVRNRQVQQNFHNYGASLFARYFIIPQLFATAEYEQINYDVTYRTGESNRQWVDRPLLGAGYFSQGRSGGGFYISLLYDVNFSSSPGYPYPSPFVYRAGIIF